MKKKNYKKLIILSCILIGFGLIAAIIALSLNNFSFNDFGNPLVSKTYDINENFESIDCNMEKSDLNIYLTDGNSYALCLENKNITFTIEVIDNVLYVKENYQWQMLLFNDTEVSLFINQDTVDKLNIKTNTGDISIIDKFKIKELVITGKTNDVELMSITSESVTIDMTTGDLIIENIETNGITITLSTGDIELNNSKINNNAKIKVTTGDVELSKNEIKEGLEVEGTTGDLEIENLNCNDINFKLSTGEISLEEVIVNNNMVIETTTGSVVLKHCDGKNIDIETTTGRVEGSILTSKQFDAESETGRVDVPKTYEGGKCKIRTTTGRIYIIIG